MAGDWNTYGPIYVSGTGRGLLYSNRSARLIGPGAMLSSAWPFVFVTTFAV